MLDLQHIERSTGSVEYHPLKPFLPPSAKVLFLGSFPPPRARWSMDFFYPNFINDHWRIMGSLFFGEKDYFVESGRKRFCLDRIVAFLQQTGIAYYDTATAVRRLKENASDKFLEVVELTDVEALLGQIPSCRVVVTTGEKATRNLMDSFSLPDMPKVGAHVPLCGDTVLFRLPSSSRAYPLSLEKKVEAYRKMFEFAGIL